MSSLAVKHLLRALKSSKTEIFLVNKNSIDSEIQVTSGFNILSVETVFLYSKLIYSASEIRRPFSSSHEKCCKTNTIAFKRDRLN